MKYRLKIWEIGDPHEKSTSHSCILKYIIINIYINIREGMREEREERESCRKERERKRENKVFLEKN